MPDQSTATPSWLPLHLVWLQRRHAPVFAAAFERLAEIVSRLQSAPAASEAAP